MIVKNNIPKLNRNKEAVTDTPNTSTGSGSVVIGSTINVIDNLVTNSPSEALSAKQGMILNDTKLNKTSVKDNLTSDSSSDALSAKLGKILNLGKLDKSAVTDNLSSTSSSNPLSARLGKNLNDNKLSKTLADSANEVITFEKGLVTKADVKTSDFGVNSGAALFKDSSGKWNLEIDKAKVRGKLDVQELNLDKAKYVGGKLICTLASIKITQVSNYSGNWYRCYFKNTDSEGNTITNNFVSGDMAFCLTFRNNHSRRWWRGVARSAANYIDVLGDKNASAFEAGSDIPEVGDEVIQLGNVNDPARLNAIIISSFDNNAPSIVQYKGINTFSLAGKEVSVISPNGNRFTGDFISKTSNKNLETMINQKADEISLSIKEIEVGGVNLYQSNTAIGVYSRGGDNSTNEVLNKNKNGFYLIGSKQSDAYAYIYSHLNEAGFYTISFRTKTNAPTPQSFTVFGTYKTKDGKNKDINLGTAHFLPSYKLSEYQSFTLNVDDKDFGSDVNFWFSSLVYTTYMISDFKIEKGNKATAWTPSPYDSNKDLLETGINISNKEITVTANKFNVRGTNGAVIADFITDKNGKPVIKAPNLDIDNIKAENCHFKYGSMSGILTKEPIEINQSNISQYLVYDSFQQDYVLDLSKLGSLIIVKGNFALNYQINLPGGRNTPNLTLNQFKYLGSLIVLINKTNEQLMICGEIQRGTCDVVYPNQICSYQCSIKKSNLPLAQGFMIGWDRVFADYVNPASSLAE